MRRFTTLASKFTIMKKLTLFAALLIFAACASDDSQPVNNPTESLLGKWKISNVTYGGSVVTWATCTYLNSFEFYENGIVETKQYLATGPSDDCQLASTTQKSYVLDGSNLTITYNNVIEDVVETDEATIIDVTNTELTVSTFMYNHPSESLPHIVTYTKVND